MKKQFLYVSTAAVLAMSFASCVDNDEPRGLRELRYAKANQWNALADQTRMQTKYVDSAHQILMNRAQELTNLYNEEHNTYTLAVEKAKADYDVAKYKYDLETQYGSEKTAEDAKKALTNAQLALKKAQDELDAYNQNASVRRAKLESEIQAALLTYQKALDETNLSKSSWTSELAKKTFTTNLTNIKNMANAKITEVDNAFTLVESKESAMILAQTNLEKAQQQFLVAVNGVEKDSLTRLNKLEDAVALANNDYEKQNKQVELAQKKYDDFVAVTEKEEKDWSDLYNEIEAEIKALRIDSANYEIELTRAQQETKAAEAEYKSKKEEVEKELKDYNDKAQYYAFNVDDAIAAEIEGEKYGSNDAEGKFQGFKAAQGVIANENQIKNSELNAKLDLILNAIGDGKKAGTSHFNLTKAEIKVLEGKIDGRKDEIKAKEANITSKKSDIAAKEAQIEKLKQDSIELANQKEIKKKYEDQVEVFLGTKAGNYADGAVAKYQAKALEYRWSDERNKSTLYEEVVEAIDAFKTAYGKATADADNATKKYQYSDEKYKVKTLRNAAQSQIKSYWTLRTAFDGTKPSKSVENNVINNNYGATESDIDKFDAIVATATISSKVCASVLNTNSRNNNGEEEGGVYGKFVKAANDLLGTTTQYRLYTEDEMLAVKATKSYPYQSSMGHGTMGEYYGWLYDLEKLSKDIADANKKIVEFKEKIAEYEDDIEKLNSNEIESKLWDDKMNDWGIEQFEAKIAVNDKWQALYDKIKAVKEANQNEINRLTLKRQEDYKNVLQQYEDKLSAAKANEKTITDNKDLVKAEMGYDSKIQQTALSLSGLQAETGMSAADKAKAIEIIIKYQLIDLEYAIETAEQLVEDKRILLEQAKKDLADFKAGEYDVVVAQKDYFEEILAADQAVKEAQRKYDQAVKDYQVAEAYLTEVLTAVE